MKVYDCFPFFNELDLLEIRLNTLNDVVDYFVISECTHTFTGKPKELHFQKHIDRFSKFKDKIIYSIVSDSPEHYDTASREIFQKNAILRPLEKCSNNDVILISDLDEIPNPIKVKEVLSDMNPQKIYVFKQNFYYYYINNLIEEDYFGTKKWNGTRLCTYEIFKFLKVNSIRNRDQMLPYSIDVSDGGWHFSFIGGKEKILEKLDAYAHQEYNTDEVRNALDKNMDCNTQDLFFRKMTAKVVSLDNTYPKYLLENIDKYIHLVRN